MDKLKMIFSNIPDAGDRGATLQNVEELLAKKFENKASVIGFTTEDNEATINIGVTDTSANNTEDVKLGLEELVKEQNWGATVDFG